MKLVKPLILASLLGLLAYLTITRQGREFARSIAGGIMDIADSALKTIKGFEGFSPVPYPDAKGQSIGYGHYIQPGESFTRITVAQADELLKSDAQKRWNSVKNLISVPLTQNQKDALASFVYNIGVSAFSDSTLLKKLNSADYVGAANQFSRWNKSRDKSGILKIDAVLTARRNSERNLFLA